MFSLSVIWQIKVPVILVGCKLDLRDDLQFSLEQLMSPIMQNFREIETCVECSALKQIQVSIDALLASLLCPVASVYKNSTYGVECK